MSEMLKMFSSQNIQHPFETLWQKQCNLAKTLGQMVRISQKFIIIFIKKCAPPCAAIVMHVNE